jgi:hypothetical protein
MANPFARVWARPLTGAVAAFPIDVGYTPVYLGRADDAKVRVADERVSKFHAALQLVVDRGYVRVEVSDNNSRAGTLVDGQPLEERRELRAPCTLALGDVARFQITRIDMPVLDTANDSLNEANQPRPRTPTDPPRTERTGPISHTHGGMASDAVWKRFEEARKAQERATTFYLERRDELLRRNPPGSYVAIQDDEIKGVGTDPSGLREHLDTKRPYLIAPLSPTP